MAGKYYTVYLRKNDEVVAQGTSKECAKQLGRTVESFYSLVSKTNKGKNRKYEVLAEEIGDDNE